MRTSLRRLTSSGLIPTNSSLEINKIKILPKEEYIGNFLEKKNSVKLVQPIVSSLSSSLLGENSKINSSSTALVETRKNDILYRIKIEGDPKAFNYPLQTLPVELSKRIPPSVLINDNNKQWKNSTPLINRLQDKVSLLLVVDPQASSDFASLEYARQWIESVKGALGERKDDIQYLKIALPSSITNILYVALMQIMNATGTVFASCDYQITNKHKEFLNSVCDSKEHLNVLLVDGNGFIRWSASGIVSVDVLPVLRGSILSLLQQKGTNVKKMYTNVNK